MFITGFYQLNFRTEFFLALLFLDYLLLEQLLVLAAALR